MTFLCFICQEKTDHQTPNCPKITCKKCGQKGHAQRDCPEVKRRNEESQEISVPKQAKIEPILVPNQSIIEDFKPPIIIKQESEDVKPGTEIVIDPRKLLLNHETVKIETQNELKEFNSCQNPIKNSYEIKNNEGLIKAFDSKTSSGILVDSAKNEWKFQQNDTKFKIGQNVNFDLNLNTKLASNVSIIKPKKPKKEKKKKLPNPTENLCILDVQFLEFQGSKQIFQIGFVLMYGTVVHSSFRSIEPLYSVPYRIFPDLNLSEFNTKLCHLDSEKVQTPTYSEKEALTQFIETLKEVKSTKIGLFVHDLDLIMPILIQRLNIYGLLQDFKKVIKYVSDLKSIVISKEKLRHFKTFCWSKFHYIYSEIFQDQDFPVNRYLVTAKQTAEYLWVIAEKIFECDDIQRCQDFKNYFYASKVLFKSCQPWPDSDKPNNSIAYQSCVFDKRFTMRK